jgi:hypothetical protein
VSFAIREMGGLVGVATSFALMRTSLLISNFPLTYIYLRYYSLVAPTFALFLAEVHR